MICYIIKDNTILEAEFIKQLLLVRDESGNNLLSEDAVFFDEESAKMALIKALQQQIADKHENIKNIEALLEQELKRCQ